jgi:hypothetical protein
MSRLEMDVNLRAGSQKEAFGNLARVGMFATLDIIGN